MLRAPTPPAATCLCLAGLAAVPRLQATEVRVHALAPDRARVEAAYTLTDGAGVELLMSWFPGQTLSEFRAAVNAVALAPDALPGRTEAGVWRWRLPGSTDGVARLQVSYVVEVAEPYAFRYPLVVPVAPATAGARPVRLEVRLPPGSTYRGGFPRLAAADGASGPRLLAVLAAVPSFVYVRYETAPRPTPWVGRAALGLLASLLGLEAWRRRRRALGAAARGRHSSDTTVGADPGR